MLHVGRRRRPATYRGRLRVSRTAREKVGVFRQASMYWREREREKYARTRAHARRARRTRRPQ